MSLNEIASVTVESYYVRIHLLRYDKASEQKKRFRDQADRHAQLTGAHTAEYHRIRPTLDGLSCDGITQTSPGIC